MKRTANNYTTFAIKNQIYDTYTHDYLGRYLRYVRDMHNIDLMPLYNCFGYATCDISLDVLNADGEKLASFDSDDDNYKIYAIPVRFFKEYTIAIDCAKSVELCCCLYDKYLDSRNQFNKLYGKTYLKATHTSFNKPFIYDRLLDLDDLLDKESITELAQNELNLKLIIKLPADNKSSITILEGNYLN